VFDWLQKLTKSEHDRWLGGVCGGLGEHTQVPSWVWRVLWVLFVLFSGGLGLVLYILLWIFMPEPKREEEQDRVSEPCPGDGSHEF